MRFENLLKPGKIGALELKNRIIMPAMATSFAAESGEVTDRLVNWLARRAKGGVGLIIVELTHTATDVDSYRSVPLPLRADDTRYIPGLTRLAEAVHQNGARVGVQLTPGAGAQAFGGGPWIAGAPAQLVSPSGVVALGRGTRNVSAADIREEDKPRVLTIEEIEEIIQLCGNAARNVKSAGFDLIEVHGHSGYLIPQFLSRHFNKRTDRYGGSLDNRCRFLLEIVGSMRKAVGPDFPLIVKYSIEERIPEGRDIKESQLIAKKLEAAGVNGITVSSGVQGASYPAVPPYLYPKGLFIHFGVALKEVIGIPVITGGRLNDPRLAETVLREGKGDFVFEGRALIVDPDWPQKVASGKIEEIRPCIACNECRQSVHVLRALRCTGNAEAGKEGQYDVTKAAGVKKKVLIVGGGPAGMEAARVAALKGHRIVLCETYRRLGGLMQAGGVHNQEITNLVKWLVTQIRKLRIDVRLQTEVTPALVKEILPDVVILANGGTFVTPKLPGVNGDNVFSAKDLLDLMAGMPAKKGVLLRAFLPLARRVVTASMVNRVLGTNLVIKKKVAIIGGQFAGCSLALLLARTKGKKVTIMEETDCYGKDMEGNTMRALGEEVEKGNVKVLTSVKITKISDRGVVLTDDKGNEIVHEADSVILALDLAPSESNLAEQLKGTVKEIYTIGDATSCGRIVKAVSEGYATAYQL
jgi:2,4-dienoyl-CoA reductase-like NADH-dependent reductase (Old Yellow Enzyme family)/NADPH-dependent 2,4-dienoyl-CoA reductase/sulfur reductase-like enzyme